MAWTSDKSPPEEVALERAWEALNHILDRRVRLSTQMRVTACFHDVLSLVPLLLELEAGEVRRSEEQRMEFEEWQRSDKRTMKPPNWDSRMSFQFATVIKALYYFVRALQDAVYIALLEAGGHRAGAHSSMGDCVKALDNPVHQLIEKELPGYFGWFAEFRDIRNSMKLGVSTYFTVRGGREAHITLQSIDDAERHVSFGRDVTLVDVRVCLTHSAQLLQLAADHIGRMPQARSANPSTAPPATD